MKTEHPILMQTDMVKATLALLKTETRRTRDLHKINEDSDYWMFEEMVINPELINLRTRKKKVHEGNYAVFIWCANTKKNNPHITNRAFVKCPYGKEGDLLWVRECFAKTSIDLKHKETGLNFIYKADVTAQPNLTSEELSQMMNDWGMKWKPSIHMPKEAARIWLEVVDIKVERLQQITNEGAKAEGVEELNSGFKDYLDEVGYYKYPKTSFETLWISINGAESWTANPWVWVIKFKVLSTTGRPRRVQIGPTDPDFIEDLYKQPSEL